MAVEYIGDGIKHKYVHPYLGKLPSVKIPIFPGKYRQNGGFSMAMLVSSVSNFANIFQTGWNHQLEYRIEQEHHKSAIDHLLYSWLGW